VDLQIPAGQATLSGRSDTFEEKPDAIYCRHSYGPLVVITAGVNAHGHRSFAGEFRAAVLLRP